MMSIYAHKRMLWSTDSTKVRVWVGAYSGRGQIKISHPLSFTSSVLEMDTATNTNGIHFNVYLFISKLLKYKGYCAFIINLKICRRRFFAQETDVTWQRKYATFK